MAPGLTERSSGRSPRSASQGSWPKATLLTAASGARSCGGKGCTPTPRHRVAPRRRGRNHRSARSRGEGPARRRDRTGASAGGEAVAGWPRSGAATTSPCSRQLCRDHPGTGHRGRPHRTRSPSMSGSRLLGVLTRDRLCDRAVEQTWATVLNEGTWLCLLSTVPANRVTRPPHPAATSCLGRPAEHCRSTRSVGRSPAGSPIVVRIFFNRRAATQPCSRWGRSMVHRRRPGASAGRLATSWTLPRR